MSDKNMPALPKFDVLHGSPSEGWRETYSKRLVRRIRAEAIEYGRQQGLAEASRLERERLEPLRVAVESLDRAWDIPVDIYVRRAEENLEAAARTLLEQTE